jgi:hypothetical protein
MVVAPLRSVLTVVTEISVPEPVMVVPSAGRFEQVAELIVNPTGVLEMVGGASAARVIGLPRLVRTPMTRMANVASRCMHFSLSAKWCGWLRLVCG